MSIDDTTDLEWIGARLKALRLEQGLTLQALADRIGATHSRISDNESGQYDVKISTLLRVLRALGTTPREFFSNMPIHFEIGVGQRETRRVRGTKAERPKKKD